MEESKNRTKVIILTRHHRILGELAHFSDTRLTDYMIESKTYIAVTNAEVMDGQGNSILTAPFLNVRNDQIEVIIPAEGATW